MHHLAFYDLDRTITRRPTWTPFLLHSARKRAPWRFALLPVVGIAGAGYALRLTDRGRLKQTMQRLMLGREVPGPVLTELVESFADQVLARGVFEGAKARIAADRDAGYRLVLATASFSYYAAVIAARLGFDAVVATEAIRGDADVCHARISGENCYGPAKLRMVQDWLAKEEIARQDAHIRFYSDHVSDAPMLEWADEAFAVNAHPPLQALAAARGWPVLDWRE